MNICQKIHALLVGEKLTRPEIRERLELSINQCENALAILLRRGEVGYNGVYPHRTYFARRHDPLPERRGRHRKSSANLTLSPTRAPRQQLTMPMHALDIAWGRGFPIAKAGD